MFRRLERIVNWLRVGYPQGIPERDYVPLVALLRRRLSIDEIHSLGADLVAQGMVPANHIDVGTGYLTITDELPSVEELQRVTNRLHEAGWPIEQPDWPDD